MPPKGVKVTAAITEAMGERVATWLREQYPAGGAKRIARDLDASPHTTRRWLEGALPENRHLAAMASRWGARFVAYIFAPAIGPDTLLAARSQLQDMRVQLDQLEADLDRTGAYSVRGKGGAAALPEPQGAWPALPAPRALEPAEGRGMARALEPMDEARP